MASSSNFETPAKETKSICTKSYPSQEENTPKDIGKNLPIPPLSDTVPPAEERLEASKSEQNNSDLEMTQENVDAIDV